MFLFEDLFPLLRLNHVFSESFLQSAHESFTSSVCESTESGLCRDESAALILKFVAMASILVAGFGGIAIPLVGKERRFMEADGNVFMGAKAFAAGVILATGFVHMLKDASEAFKNPCLGSYTWSKFPFPGFFAMVAALFTLLVDSVATQYYERKVAGGNVARGKGVEVVSDGGSDDESVESAIVEVKDVGKVLYGEEASGGLHIVGMHAHAAHHGHSNSHGHGHGHDHTYSTHHHDDVESTVRHVVVSQVLELGIVSHSMIIGLSLGVSQSPCTMRPLIVALSFHQFFEGFALGGCISQAQVRTLPATIMACFFALTTPLGVAIGASIASIFNPYSPGALITEGILDSLSAGILVYMSLVDLIAADFLSKKMRCNFSLQILCYCLLFLGAGLMSLLAIWA